MMCGTVESSDIGDVLLIFAEEQSDVGKELLIFAE